MPPMAPRAERSEPSRPIPSRPATPIAIGLVAMALGLVLPDDHLGRLTMLMLGSWLVVAALVGARWASGATAPDLPRPIPVHFSGELGRFRLRSRGDGRRVEVRSGQTVVAELIARDDGDELMVDFRLADDPEVDAFGAALGLAIEMVVAADEDAPAPRQSYRPGSAIWGIGDRPMV